MGKKILLLGGSAQQVVAIETAKRLGYDTVLCDYLPDNPGQYAADMFYQVSTTDKQAVLEVARREQVDGVLAYASDPAAPTAAYVAEVLGLPGNPLKSVELLCNKDQFRGFLAQNGFAVPWARGFASWDEVRQEADGFVYPLIVKPVDSSGSKGATVLTEAAGLREAAAFALSFSRSHRIVIEHFIEKKHPYLIGGDIFVVDGKICLWGLMNCHRDSRANPLVPAGKSYPLLLEQKDREQVEKTLCSLVEKLGIRTGSMNVELVVDRGGDVYLIDVGPRSGGNMIPDLLGDIFGVDIAAMSVEAAMGNRVCCTPHAPSGCYATHNLHSLQGGRYCGIQFTKELKACSYRTCLYKKWGDTVEFFDNAAKALGIVFMKFHTEEEMFRMLEHIDTQYQVELEKERSHD